MIHSSRDNNLYSIIICDSCFSRSFWPLRTSPYSLHTALMFPSILSTNCPFSSRQVLHFTMKTPTAVEMSEKTKNQSNGVAQSQAASTQMLNEKFRKVEEVFDDDETECPLCMEPFDIDDIDFFPCSCGYQVCRFCWHRLKDEESGLCPACRQVSPQFFTVCLFLLEQTNFSFDSIHLSLCSFLP